MKDSKKKNRLNRWIDKQLPTYENGVRKHKRFAQKCAAAQYQSLLFALTIICGMAFVLLLVDLSTTKPWYRDMPISEESQLHRYFNGGYTHGILQVDTLEQIGTLTDSSTTSLYLPGLGMELLALPLNTTETTYHTYLYTVGNAEGFYLGPDGVDESSVLQLQRISRGTTPEQLVQKWNRSDPTWIYSKLVSDLAKETGQPVEYWKDKLLPEIVVYSKTPYQSRIYSIITLAIVFFTSFFLRYVFRIPFVRRRTNFGKQLTQYGTLKEMEHRLNEESINPIYVDSDLMLTQNYLVRYHLGGNSPFQCQMWPVEKIKSGEYDIDHVFDDGDIRYRLWFVAGNMVLSTTTMDECAARKATEHVELYSPLARLDQNLAALYSMDRPRYDSPKPRIRWRNIVIVLLCFMLLGGGIWLLSSHTHNSVEQEADAPMPVSVKITGDGSWYYNDIQIKTCDKVYGYERLTPGAQQAFDMMYGEYFSQDVRTGEQKSIEIVLPQPLTEEEFDAARRLYQACKVYECYPRFAYLVERYANPALSMEIYNLDGTRRSDLTGFRNDAAVQKAEQIISRMPQGLSDYDKCCFIADYLVQYTRYAGMIDNGEPLSDQTEDGEFTILQLPLEHQTSYGALLNGQANCEGYSQAFAALAYYADLPAITVSGRVSSGKHMWNMVKLDGEWYHIDITWMDSGDEVDYTYFLADDLQIAATHQAYRIYRYDEVELPTASSLKHNWFVQNELYFHNTQEAVAKLSETEFGPSDVVRVRMDSAEELESLLKEEIVSASGGLAIYTRANAFTQPVTATITRSDYMPKAEIDWDALRSQVPYGGLRAVEAYDIPIPVIGDRDQQILSRTINNLFADFPIGENRFFDIEYPDEELVLYLALQHTTPILWEDASVYGSEFSGLENRVFGFAPQAVFQEHVQETADRLLGKRADLVHRDMVAPYDAPDQAIWKYDADYGVYVHHDTIPHTRIFNRLVVLDYQQEERRYTATAAFLRYYHNETRGNERLEGYIVSMNNHVESDSPELLDYCYDKAPRYQIVLEEGDDGFFQLISCLLQPA